MDAFSQPTVAAACSALSSKAQSTALAIQLGLPTEIRAQDALQKQLSSLSARLQQFANHASQLGHCVADAVVVDQAVGDVFALSLIKCQDGLGIMTAGLDSTNAGADGKLSRELITSYDGFIAAYSRLFVLGTQLLIMWVFASGNLAGYLLV
jgi:hypothetical protein